MPQSRGEVSVAWSAGFRVTVPDGAPPPQGFPVLLALHGFGDTGARLEERLPALEGARFAVIYPDGPFPVEMRREGAPTRVGASWYQYTGDQEAFRASLRFTADHLSRVLAAAKSNHPLDLERLAVLGYSQGGYVAGTMALWDPDRYQALVAIGTRVKLEVVDDLTVAAKLPIMVMHGRKDRAIAFDRQMEMVESLRSAGVDVTVHAHEGGHGLRPERSAPVRDFLDSTLVG